MATYHTSIHTFSRAKKHSAIAAAAYRGALLLTDPITGATHDYRGRAGVLRVRCMVPPGSPSWADDPQALWAAAEAAEKRKDSTVARNFQIALPHELDEAKQWDLILDVSKHLVDRFGFAIQMSHHGPTGDDPRHFYAHMLATTRKMEASGLTAKTRELDGRINGKLQVDWIREMVAHEINRHLRLSGIDATVDHRSDFERRLMALRNRTFPAAWEAIPFDQMLDRYRKEARLLEIPDGHSHERALEERGSSTGQASEEAGAGSQRSDGNDNYVRGDAAHAGG